MNKLSDNRLADVNGYCQYQYPLCSEDTGNCNAKGLTHPMSEVFYRAIIFTFLPLLVLSAALSL